MGDPAGGFWINKLLRCLKIVSSVKHLRLSQLAFYQMFSGKLFPQDPYTCASEFSNLTFISTDRFRFLAVRDTSNPRFQIGSIDLYASSS